MRTIYTILILTALAAFTGCSGYDQLVKSRDYQKQYEEALRYYSLKKDSKAISLFENVESIFAGTDKIDTIKFHKAKANYRSGDYYAAADLMDEFRKNYSRSPFLEEAEYLYAMCYYQLSPNPELDQSNTAFAINAFAEYLERHPESARREACMEMIEELQSRIYSKTFAVGQTYYNIGYYNSAIHSFRNTLKKYPDTPQREQILYLLVKANYQYAKASIPAKQRERYYNTIDAYYNFVSEYPESKYRPEVERMFKNAQRLARGQEATDEVSRDYNLTEHQAGRLEKKALRLTDRLENRRISLEELDSKVDKSIRRIEKARGTLLDEDTERAAKLDKRRQKAEKRRLDTAEQIKKSIGKTEAKLAKVKERAEQESTKGDRKERKAAERAAAKASRKAVEGDTAVE